ncbi:MAG: DUF423 domain-containing protein [Longimicrobiales bacterium]|nr:DUF423 domain-containing protein [Longimicrobiales bacterium]
MTPASMERTFALAGALAAFVAVALGAFGAHALEARVEPRDLEIWRTAVRYQMWHALALLGIAALHARWPGGGTVVAGWSFVAGIVIFSGSLYLLVGSGARWLGAITPIGGVAFLVGWAALIRRLFAA